MSNPTELPDLDRQFRKKPVVIEAIQWTGKLACLDAFNIPELHQSLGSNMVGIPTLEGTMIARVGDWIIKGVKGEFYPCKPDIFAATYEPAARRAQPEGESAACKGCNGHGMVGNILDTDVCPFCQGSGQESAPVPAAQPAESGKEVAAQAEACYGVYRQHPEENDGKEFFFCSMWHNETNWGDGHRVVKGRFVPDSDAPATTLSPLCGEPAKE